MFSKPFPEKSSLFCPVTSTISFNGNNQSVFLHIKDGPQLPLFVESLGGSWMGGMKGY